MNYDPETSLGVRKERGSPWRGALVFVVVAVVVGMLVWLTG